MKKRGKYPLLGKLAEWSENPEPLILRLLMGMRCGHKANGGYCKDSSTIVFYSQWNGNMISMLCLTNMMIAQQNHEQKCILVGHFSGIHFPDHKLDQEIAPTSRHTIKKSNRTTK